MDFSTEYEPGQHIIIVGRTGSGKSVIAGWVLNQITDCYKYRDIIIPKGDKAVLDEITLRTDVCLYPPRKVDTLYIPKPSEFEDREYYDKILKAAYYRKNTLTYIDDLAPLHTVGGYGPDHLRYILSLGRSRLSVIVAAVQRPHSIPLSTLSESTWLFVSALTVDNDIRRIREMVPDYQREYLPILKENRYTFLAINFATGSTNIVRVTK